MSEQTSAETATETAQPNKQEPDDSEPSPERQVELRTAYEKNIAGGKPPYAGVVIRTRGEVNWIVQERGWRTGGFDTLDQAIDFRRVGVDGAVLSHLDLSFANLSDAVISDSTVSEAGFTGAKLVGAFISDSTVSEANFTNANLSGAFIADNISNEATFTNANLSGAIFGGDFTNADLRGINLSGAIVVGDFSGADMTQARMDSSSVLGASDATDVDETFQLSTRSRLLDVAWNGAILANVRWERVPRLGDEADTKAAETRAERVVAIRNAARAYRGLAKALQAQGLTAPALKYRRREYQLERRALLYSFALGPWIFSWLLNIVSGYGDKPARALACYLAVVGSFAGAYWAITNQVFSFITSSSAHLAWYEALVLSISSFHGRGFFPSIPSLGDPIAIVAAAEAIIGLFIELVFIATFTQRFFAR